VPARLSRYIIVGLQGVTLTFGEKFALWYVDIADVETVIFFLVVVYLVIGDVLQVFAWPCVVCFVHIVFTSYVSLLAINVSARSRNILNL